ncbi:MAG: FAD-dependent monooxygenase [Proteobacteria bacterium]|nr:FAD-dependent monooxygenase [Pseudomonadota bacterium]
MSARSRGAAAVTIVGAGPVGTLLALLLAADGRRVRVLERRADPRSAPAERGRSINLALAARGLAALARAGVLERVQPELVAMRGRQLHDRDGRGPLLPYGLRQEEQIHAVDRARLNTALIEAAARVALIELEFDRRAIDVEPDSGRVSWVDGAGAQHADDPAALVIGADGAGSALRQALQQRGTLRATEEPLAHDYKELHVPATPTGDWPLAPHALHIWPRGEFMLIALPNPDRSFTATLFLPARGRDSFETLIDRAAVRAFFAREFPDALALIPDFDAQFAAHPQGKLGTLYCWPWHARRVLLVGDAAHAIVPFHGQGLNCGFEDCVLLADLLAGGRDEPSACVQFERQRRPDTDAIAAMAIENYREMRATVLAPDFAARKQLALDLEQRFPGRFIPRYSMVMFHAEIPYAEAQRRGARQDGVLDALLAAGAGADSALATKLLADAAL